MHVLPRSLFLPRRVLMAALTLFAVGTAQLRAQFVWSDASGTNSNLSTATNWQGNLAPDSNSDVEFDGAGGSSVILDVPSFSVNTVTFNGSNGYVISAVNGGSLVFSGCGSGAGIYNNATAPITVIVPIELDKKITVQNENGPLSILGLVSGSGGVTIDGESVVILTGANTYTGKTKIDEGASLNIGDNSTLHSGIVSNVTNNGQLTFLPAATDTMTYNGVICGYGQVNLSGDGKLMLGGNNTYYGDTDVNSGILADCTDYAFSANSSLVVSNGASVQVNHNEDVANLQNAGTGGNVSIASGKVLGTYGTNYVGDFLGTISGAGSIELYNDAVQGFAGNNTFSGGVNVDSYAELFIGSNNALGTGTVTFYDNAEFSPTADNLTLANPIVLNSEGFIENEDGANYNMTLTGQITGTGGIDWCTTGVLTLSNATNSFSGGLDMRLGTLNLTATGASGTGSIYLDTGANLLISSGVTVSNPINFIGTASQVAGNGTLATPVTANGGNVLNPSASNGTGVGTLTFTQGLTIDSGAAIHFSLHDVTGAAGVGYSTIDANTLAFTASPSTITFNLVTVNAAGVADTAMNFNGLNSYSWTVFSSGSIITGFNPNEFLIDTSGFLNGPGYFSFAEVGNSVVLNFSPVPEPSTWVLMGLGLVALVPVGLRYRRLARA